MDLETFIAFTREVNSTFSCFICKTCFYDISYIISKLTSSQNNQSHNDSLKEIEECSIEKIIDYINYLYKFTYDYTTKNEEKRMNHIFQIINVINLEIMKLKQDSNKNKNIYNYYMSPLYLQNFLQIVQKDNKITNQNNIFDLDKLYQMISCCKCNDKFAHKKCLLQLIISTMDNKCIKCKCKYKINLFDFINKSHKKTFPFINSIIYLLLFIVFIIISIMFFLFHIIQNKKLLYLNHLIGTFSLILSIVFIIKTLNYNLNKIKDKEELRDFLLLFTKNNNDISDIIENKYNIYYFAEKSKKRSCPLIKNVYFEPGNKNNIDDEEKLYNDDDKIKEKYNVNQKPTSSQNKIRQNDSGNVTGVISKKNPKKENLLSKFSTFRNNNYRYSNENLVGFENNLNTIVFNNENNGLQNDKILQLMRKSDIDYYSNKHKKQFFNNEVVNAGRSNYKSLSSVVKNNDNDNGNNNIILDQVNNENFDLDRNNFNEDEFNYRKNEDEREKIQIIKINGS